MIKINAEQEQEICKLYSVDNILTPEIGRMFGVYYWRICLILKKNNIKIKNKKMQINPGDKFGRWTIIEEIKTTRIMRHFLCECSCPAKTKRAVSIGNLRNGTSKSCGCYSRERTSETKLNSGKDYTGYVFGRLTLLYEVERNKRGGRQYMAQCSCPSKAIKIYLLDKMISGDTSSCGCYKIQMIKETNTYQVKDYQEKHPLFCQIEEIMDDPNGPGILVRCKHSNCRKWFKPTKTQIYSRLAVIEMPQNTTIGTENLFYCSNECKDSCPLYKTHSDPLDIRGEDMNKALPYELFIWTNEVFKRQCDEYGYNFCVKCHSMNNLHAHHIDPQKLEPGYSLDPENGIIFCSDCHYSTGHKGECSTTYLANIVCNYTTRPLEVKE